MLSVLIWLPIIVALPLAFLPQVTAKQARAIALSTAGFTVLWSAWLFTQFDLSNPGFQFREFLPWLPLLGLNYDLGLDGLSLLMVALNSLITWMALWSSRSEMERPKLFYGLMLLVNGGVAGAFLAQNLLLFFLLYEIELVPLYLLVAIWGGQRRTYAATKFLLYTAVSGALMLASFLATVWLTQQTDFAYTPALGQTLPMTGQLILLGMMLVAFGIKIPLVPFHTWLPDAHVEASTPLSVLLAGVLLKLGTYGILRFGLGLFPEAWMEVAPLLAWWAVVSVLYGSLAAIAQTDMKKMVAYSSVGHMGYILLAASAANPLSILGTVMQMVSHGLISGLLFLLVGVVYAKTGTRDLTVLRGLLNFERGLPIVGSLMILGVMASAGIPGMIGFISEFVVFRGSFLAFPQQTLLCMVGSGLTAVYFLLLVNRVFFGRLAITPPSDQTEPDVLLPPVAGRDRWPALVLVLIIFALGLQPHWLSRWSEVTTFAMRSPEVEVAQRLTPVSSEFSPQLTVRYD